MTSSRRKAGAAPATVAYELAILRQAFRRAKKVLPRIPTITISTPKNARKGFFEPAELDAVLAQLPDYLRPMIQFAALTGWRIPSEVLPLQWSQVDFQAGTVVLEHRATKNGEPRTFPFSADPRLVALLTSQRNYTDVMQEVAGRPIPWVFHHFAGKPIRHFYQAWHAACQRAGVTGRIPHDLRRTAVRTWSGRASAGRWRWS